MATQSTRTLTVRQAQAKASKKATLEMLRSKRRRRKDLEIELDGEKVTLVFEAISSHDMDALVAAHPPTKDQQLQGIGFNPETFNPALIAACLVEPKVTPEEFLEIWQSDAWSQGELSTLFNTAWQLTMEGLDVPFFGNDSEKTRDSA